MTPRRAKVPWSHGDKFLMIALGLVVVLVIGVGIWFYNLDKDPEVSVPSPVMPTRNAYDYYKAAAAGIVAEKTLSDIFSQHPEGPQARHTPSGMYSRSALSQDYVYSVAEKDALVSKKYRGNSSVTSGIPILIPGAAGADRSGDFFALFYLP